MVRDSALLRIAVSSSPKYAAHREVRLRGRLCISAEFRRYGTPSALSPLRHGHYRTERLAIRSTPGGIEALERGLSFTIPALRRTLAVPKQRDESDFSRTHTEGMGGEQCLAKGPAKRKQQGASQLIAVASDRSLIWRRGFFLRKARCDRVGPVGVIRGLSRRPPQRRLAAVRVRGRWVSADLVAVVGYCTRASAVLAHRVRSSVQCFLRA